MKRQHACALIVSALFLFSALPARAHDHAHAEAGAAVTSSAHEHVHLETAASPVRASAFTYSYRGFLAGSLIGLGAGYLAVRPQGVHGDDWRGLVFGAGLGAIAGAGLGLSLGLLDLADSHGRWGHWVTRDMLGGVGFGALAGTATGGLVALQSGEGEHVLMGTAVGTIGGGALGIVVGVLEGHLRARRMSRHERTVRATITISQDGAGKHVWTPVVSGRF